MKTIWKYILGNVTQRVEMPLGAKLLDVQSQDGFLTLWALVDIHNDMCYRHIRVVETGEHWDSINESYVGTVQFPRNGYVLHVFDLGEDPKNNN